MKDALGNKMNAGDMLVWHIPEGLREIVVIVARASDGGLSIGSTDQVSPAQLSIMIEIPVSMPRGQEGMEPHIHEMMRVVDPRSEAVIAGMTRQ